MNTRLSALVLAGIMSGTGVSQAAPPQAMAMDIPAQPLAAFKNGKQTMARQRPQLLRPH